MHPAANQANEVEAVFSWILQKWPQIALQPLILDLGDRHLKNDTGCCAEIVIKAAIDILPNEAGDERIFRAAPTEAVKIIEAVVERERNMVIGLFGKKADCLRKIGWRTG